MFAAPFLLFMVAYITIDVPKPEELVTKQVSKIYAADTQTELARIVPAEGNRQAVTLDKIPEVTRNAVLAAEDREFYSNNGFSFTGFARAILGQVTGNTSAGGGSTITQQYVKNMVVGNDYSYKRKAKELVYSVKMANEWSKEQVLEAYLNTIYFGRNAYGIDAAARAYFGVPVEELNAAQSAVLAASIQRPSQLDPWNNREEAEQRWGYVLDGMVEEGWLSPEDRANALYPDTTDPALNQAYTEAQGTNGLIKHQVMAELDSLGITEDDVQTRGLRITTTIDPQAQQATVDTIRTNMANQKENLRTAAVSIEPATGAVRAYYGGEDPNGWDYANAGYQTGSTFKIFGYAAALQQGFSPNQMISSAPFTLANGAQVAGGGCGGGCTMKEALKQSLNPPFLRLQAELNNTTQDVADMAHALGVAKSIPNFPQTLTENGAQPYEGIILGQYNSRPLDMAHAMATMANMGVWHEAYFVEKVETANGDILYQHEHDKGERRLAQNVAANTIEAMLPIAGWSNGNNLAGGRPSAAKTGTQQLGDTGLNKDAWMIGATPQLATAVWVGTDDNSALLNEWGGSIYGAGLPATLWKGILDGALQGKEVMNFPEAKPLAHITKGGNIGQIYIQPPVVPNDPQTPPPANIPPVDAPPAPPAPAEVEILPGVSIPADLLGVPPAPEE
ncbi:MAG: transglycosylase domain-containing protein [Corynebacterium sp.]|uniref:transglycosylase domain-containing protein n=1 Tax=Corynebacterium sp. TaxID=1720 RepID=UPI0026DD2814|nr:transglycosylase domain-containing protein [Corynebacterium sp.]MDO4762317.1 transglycosylase domain-containing protein [Corynebacterium sp.]